MSNHAFVFPGQGSQSVGMLAELAVQYPSITQTFEMVSERLGYDVWHLVQQGPLETLNETVHTQVVMLTADISIYNILMQQGVTPAAIMAGHSLGEYAALVAAGALTLPDAAMLVRTRGQLMQETVPLGAGAMAAIVGLTDEQVQQLCEEVSTAAFVVSPANFNAVGQVVIAGHTEAVVAAIERAEILNARLAKIIPVSVPCHCSLLEKAAEQFQDALLNTAFEIPKIPVISNVDLSIYQSTEQMRMLLQAQLYRPVRWVETIQTFKNKGIEFVIECGPGKVLSGLIKRIDNTLRAVSANDQASIDSIVNLLGSKG